MNAAKPPATLGDAPICQDLGVYRCKKGEFKIELRIRIPQLAALIRAAMLGRGRASIAGGGIVVLAKRIPPPATVVVQGPGGDLLPDRPPGGSR